MERKGRLGKAVRAGSAMTCCCLRRPTLLGDHDVVSWYLSGMWGSRPNRL